jgi:hypothetical protein
MSWNSLTDDQLVYILRGRFLVGRCINKPTRDALMRALAGGNYLVRLTVVVTPFTPFADRLRFAKSLVGACFLVPTRAMVKQWRAKNRNIRMVYGNEKLLVNRAENGPEYNIDAVELGSMLSRWNDPVEHLPSGTNVSNLCVPMRTSIEFQLLTAADPSVVPSVVQAFDAFFSRIANHPTFVSQEYMFRAVKLWVMLPDNTRWPVRSGVAVPPFLTAPGGLLAMSRVAAVQPRSGRGVVIYVFDRLGTGAITGDAHAAEILANIRLLMPSTDRMTYIQGVMGNSWDDDSDWSFVQTMGDYAAAYPTLRSLLVAGGWKELWADVDGELRSEANWLLLVLLALDY